MIDFSDFEQEEYKNIDKIKRFEKDVNALISDYENGYLFSESLYEQIDELVVIYGLSANDISAVIDRRVGKVRYYLDILREILTYH